MARELAIYYTLMHFMWGVKSGATLAGDNYASNNKHSLSNLNVHVHKIM